MQILRSLFFPTRNIFSFSLKYQGFKINISFAWSQSFKIFAITTHKSKIQVVTTKSTLFHKNYLILNTLFYRIKTF